MKKPTVTVKDSEGNILKNETDYSVSYATGRTSVGRYKVTITYKGKYSGSKAIYFTIVPKAPSSASASLSTASGGYDDIKFTWKASTGTTKYYSSKQYKTASVYTLKKVSQPTVAKSGTKVKVTWTNINGESGYQISRSTTKNGINVVSTYATTSGKSKIVKATKGKTYYYRVRAYKNVKVGTKTYKVYGLWSEPKSYKRR